MHYVLGDIHNELRKLKSILDQIHLGVEDELIVLGDIFDRGADEPDPVGVYFELCKIQEKCTWVRGNHDQWLADYINKYYGASERQRRKMSYYWYNSFELMKDRLTPVDMLNLADLIMGLPLQIEIEIGSAKYLLAHAMTFDPAHGVQKEALYLEGLEEMQEYWEHGVKGYVSLVGHHDSGYQHSNPKGDRKMKLGIVV